MRHKTETSLQTHFDVYVSARSLSTYELFENGKFVYRVGYSGFYDAASITPEEVGPRCWSIKGGDEISCNQYGEIIVNDLVVGRMTKSSFLSHLHKVLTTRFFSKYVSYLQVDFDSDKIAPSNALSLLLMKLSFLKSG